MKDDSYAWFADILIEYGAKIRAYSGRGMYGEECLGVELESSALEFAADVIDGYHLSGVGERWATLATLLRTAREDTLGLGRIVYFPRVKWREEWAQGAES